MRAEYLIIALGTLFCSAKLCSQNQEHLSEMQLRELPITKNTINFEISGNALVYSLNYDRVLLQTEFYKGTLRIGAGVLPYPSEVKESRNWIFIPIEYNNLFGPKNHFLELSIGTTYTHSFQGANHWVTGRIGYRLQGFNTGFFFRAGLVLLYIPYANPQAFNYEIQDFTFPLPAVAWGISF